MYKGPDHFGRHSVCERGHNTGGTEVTGSICMKDRYDYIVAEPARRAACSPVASRKTRQ